MKTKLDLAHEWYMKNMYQTTHEKAVVKAWNYADAMYEQLEKRESRGVPEGILNRCNSTKLEWQPDWSQAPEWANWWAMDLDLDQAHWYEVEPTIDAITWRRRTRTCKKAPSFNYQGNWQDSLRKRPEDK